MSYSTVGKPLARVEGPAKVTGEAKYTADVLLPGMIWGKALRSPLPHARIVRIDATAAERMPGVLAVLTARDLPDVLTGRVVYDMPVLARDRVRFIGEKVAVVAAENPDVAEDALTLIDVEYEELPTVFEAEDAMKQHAPLLHPDYKSYRYAPKQYFSDIPNVHSHLTWKVGDLAQGFALAQHTFEHTFRTYSAHQGFIEPNASVVSTESDGKIHCWTTNKMPVRVRELLSDAILVPKEQIVVHMVPLGGDFGGKGALMDLTLCYHLSRRTGRPVKMVMTYTEELMAGNPRHPTTVILRTGVAADGKIVAREAKVLFNSGAYAAFKPTPPVNILGASQAVGVYGIPHLRIDAYSVYTNRVPAGHVRAPGDPQAIFAAESAMDMIAEALGMDRLEFRRQNLLKDGDLMPEGHALEHVKVRETLDAAVRASNWGKPKTRPNIGRGIGIGYRNIGTGFNNVALELQQDGTVVLSTPVPETGAGMHTVLQQIVAEALNVPTDQVKVRTDTTDKFEADLGAGASRVTHVAGLAACEAVNELTGVMCEVAAKALNCDVKEIECAAGFCRVRSAQDRRLSLAEVARIAVAEQRPLRVQKLHRVMKETHITAFTAQVVELEVDPETGQITVIDFVTAHDVGTIINPLAHQGQIEGGVIQGLGFAMMEEIRIEEGRVSTLSLGDYKLPNIQDIPPLKTLLVFDEHGPVPFHGKAIGESSITPVPAAIANAVYDAVGVRLYDLPITAEKIYQALRAKGASEPKKS